MKVYSHAKTSKSRYGKGFGAPGSILILELNLKRQELICHVNGENCGVVFHNIVRNDKTRYKFAISLFYIDAVVQIQDFECI